MTLRKCGLAGQRDSECVLEGKGWEGKYVVCTGKRRERECIQLCSERIRRAMLTLQLFVVFVVTWDSKGSGGLALALLRWEGIYIYFFMIIVVVVFLSVVS